MPQRKRATEVRMYQPPAGSTRVHKISREGESALRKFMEKHFEGSRKSQTRRNMFQYIPMTEASTPMVMHNRRSSKIYSTYKSWVSGREIPRGTAFVSLKPSRGRKRTILKVR